jgi:dihydrofolate synthase/folylpolyglutamate synthase
MPETLDGWLDYIESQHPSSIALGLDRVLTVKAALRQQKTCPLIIVGGTNGKGSTCAMIERILLCAGYHVGLYTSPHLLCYNERVRVDGVLVDDAVLCKAFQSVEHAREGIPLTYFEFGTLAAWEVFSECELDAVILEVGLGGRLDAVNAYDADCSVIVSVDLDHMDYLGTTRDQIGYEKAGIFRAKKTAICGDINPPDSLIRYALAIDARLQLIGQDFSFRVEDSQWQYAGLNGKRSGLAYPALRGRHQLTNASCALAALDALQCDLPVVMQDVRRGLLEVELTGRFQVVPGRPSIVLDVAHNPHAAGVLARNLGDMAYHPETWAVFGAMSDKDIAGIIAALKERITQWLPCDLGTARSAKASWISHMLAEQGLSFPAGHFSSPRDAFRYAQEHAGEDDRILVFGSFLTVADAMRSLSRKVQ